MILAGDIGGTNARLALFAHDELGEPARLDVFPSAEFETFEAIVARFMGGEPAQIEAASFGIAGPVKDGRSHATNLDWDIDSTTLAALLELEQVGLLNDLEATAVGLDVLPATDLLTINEGEPDPSGNVAVIAAGTGLGQAGVVRVDGRPVPFATEAGHAGFAPATSEQTSLLEFLRDTIGPQISVEMVCSGMGLVNIFRWCLAEAERSEPAWLARELDEGDAAAAIAAAAEANSDQQAARALGVFVDIYGSEAGNVALRLLATGGVYVAGGIATKLSDSLVDGRFLRAFLAKSRLVELLGQTPVRLVANDNTALLGAARHASQQRA